MFYFKDHRIEDADLHYSILDVGDHAAAEEVGHAVMRRLGLSEETIAMLTVKAARARVRERATRILNRKV